jgi:hypothetical protein
MPTLFLSSAYLLRPYIVRVEGLAGIHWVRIEAVRLACKRHQFVIIIQFAISPLAPTITLITMPATVRMNKGTQVRQVTPTKVDFCFCVARFP